MDTTFRGWSSTLAAGVRLAISRLVMIFALLLDFHGRFRVVRSMYLPAALHGIEASLLASDSLRKLPFLMLGGGGPLLDVFGSLQLLSSGHVRERCVGSRVSLFHVGSDCGRAMRCMLHLGCSRFLHLVVLYGCQGADNNAEHLL